MNQEILYQWSDEIAKRFSCLNSWQINNVALFSQGIIEAENCQLQKIARKVAIEEQVGSAVRRLGRFLDNKKFPSRSFCVELTSWL